MKAAISDNDFVQTKKVQKRAENGKHQKLTETKNRKKDTFQCIVNAQIPQPTHSCIFDTGGKFDKHKTTGIVLKNHRYPIQENEQKVKQEGLQITNAMRHNNVITYKLTKSVNRSHPTTAKLAAVRSAAEKNFSLGGKI